MAGFNRFAHSAGPSRGEVAEEEGNNKNNNKNNNEYNSNDNIRNDNHKVPKLGKAVLMVANGLTDASTTLKRPSGAPNTSQRQPHNAPKAIIGSKKRANQAQESSKSNLDALFGRSRGLKELPRDPQELPKVARGSFKTLSKPSLGRKR